MKLWLLRHARVQVPPGLCYGASEVQAEPAATLAAARRFAPHPAKGCPVWVSPAARAQQLAQALWAQRPDLQAPQTDARLREMDFGQWEMQAWAQIPREAIEAWTGDFAHHRFGGQESSQEVVDRVAQALQALRTQGEGEAVWITHAGVIRAAQCWLSRGGQPLRSAQDWPESAPAMGDWLALDL